MVKKEEKISWTIPEYKEYKRGWWWYAIALVVVVGLLIYSISTSNFLFALIIIIASAIIIVDDSQKPRKIKVEISDDGFDLGQKSYDFDEFKDFSIIYKPKDNIKTLYFEFRNGIRPRLSIPLQNRNPLIIRNFLLQYLDEDLERIAQPFSERIGKLLKL